MSEVKQAEGHAPGCDGNCSEIHDKKSMLHAAGQGIAAVRKDSRQAVTPESGQILDAGYAALKRLADDPSVPDTVEALAAMQTILICYVRAAGAYAFAETLRPGNVPAGKLN
jgi:hypothetical protein